MICNHFTSYNHGQFIKKNPIDNNCKLIQVSYLVKVQLTQACDECTFLINLEIFEIIFYRDVNTKKV